MGPRAVIARINVDGSATVLSEADETGSMQDSTSSIVRLDDGGAVEIARSSPGLFNFSGPTINDSGVVAFKAVVPTSFIS